MEKNWVYIDKSSHVRILGNRICIQVSSKLDGEQIKKILEKAEHNNVQVGISTDGTENIKWHKVLING